MLEIYDISNKTNRIFPEFRSNQTSDDNPVVHYKEGKLTTGRCQLDYSFSPNSHKIVFPVAHRGGLKWRVGNFAGKLTDIVQPTSFRSNPIWNSRGTAWTYLDKERGRLLTSDEKGNTKAKKLVDEDIANQSIIGISPDDTLFCYPLNFDIDKQSKNGESIHIKRYSMKSENLPDVQVDFPRKVAILELSLSSDGKKIAIRTFNQANSMMDPLSIGVYKRLHIAFSDCYSLWTLNLKTKHLNETGRFHYI